jgi:hypothetical protein
MSQIITKGIEDLAVTTAKIAATAVTNAKVATGIDASKLADGSVSNTEFQYLGGVTSDIQTQFTNKISTSEINANNGVCPLDAGGKVPAANLPNSVMEFQGSWNANTNSPALIDGTGSAGDVYRVGTAGTQDLGSGSQTFSIGDWVMYSGSVWQKANNSNLVDSVNGQTGVVVLDTDDISEGTALYFTDERAQDAVGTILVDTASVDLAYNDGTPSITATVLPAGVDHDALLNFVANEHISHTAVNINTNANSGLSGGGDISSTRNLVIDPSNGTSGTVASGDLVLVADVSAANALIKVTAQSIADLAGAGITPRKDDFTLGAGDITNQFIDLSNVAIANSIHFLVKGLIGKIEGASHDYSVNLTGGAGGNTRITFLNDIATGGPEALIAGDFVQVKYMS